MAPSVRLSARDLRSVLSVSNTPHVTCSMESSKQSPAVRFHMAYRRLPSCINSALQFIIDSSTSSSVPKKERKKSEAFRWLPSRINTALQLITKSSALSFVKKQKKNKKKHRQTHMGESWDTLNTDRLGLPPSCAGWYRKSQCCCQCMPILFALGLLIGKSTSPHPVWLQMICHIENAGSTNMQWSFEPSLWPWPWTQQSNLFKETPACSNVSSNYVWLEKDTSSADMVVSADRFIDLVKTGIFQ